MNRYVTEHDLDTQKILRRIGENSYGDEDFDIFKCPCCGKIYLIDYEIGSIFIDSVDLTILRNGSDFTCISCGYAFPKGVAIIGPKADEHFRVTWHDLEASEWSWIAGHEGPS